MVLRTLRNAGGPVVGAFAVPASKSLAQRALTLAVLADGDSEIVAAGPTPDDVAGFARALAALGGRPVPASGVVSGAFGEQGLGASRASVRCDLARNATGLRLALVLAGLRPAGARTLLRGDRRLLLRPHRPLTRALATLGGHVRRRHSGSLRVLGAPWTRHGISLDASISSQYASALLLAAPRAGGLRLTATGDAVSAGYLDLSLDVLRAFGVPVRVEGPTTQVEACVPRGRRFVVEPDASSAAVWWTVAALTGGSASVPGLPLGTAQPDAALLPILSRMGARIGVTPTGEARVEGPRAGALEGAGDVDLRATPDLAPLVAVLAGRAAGVTRIVRTEHLRSKESDRVATVVTALRACGVHAEPAVDGFVVEGGGARGGRVPVAGDHRIALAFGALGLVVPGVELAGAEAVSKSWPGGLDRLEEAAAAARGEPLARP